MPDKNEDFASPETRKIRFKDLAREIVSKDRDYRKSGLPVDTAGAVARAMEKAFKLGQQVALGEIKPAEKKVDLSGVYMEWKLIPARSRDALDRIFRYGYLVGIRHEPWAGKDAGSCWTKDHNDKLEFVDKFGDQTISILLRNNLGKRRLNQN